MSKTALHAVLFVAFGAIMVGLIVFLKGMSSDFVVGFAAGIAVTTGLLYAISPRIRDRLES